MRKLLALSAAVLLIAGCSAKPAETPQPTPEATPETTPTPQTVDNFTSASVSNFYADSSLSGEALWDAFDKMELAPTIATVNPDGTANLAVFIPGYHTELNGEDYFGFGFAENQTIANIQRTKTGVISLFIYNPAAEEKADRYTGARLVFELVEDADTLKALKEANEKISDTATMVKVTEIKPIG